MKCQKDDRLACPEIDGYNYHSIEKGKDAPFLMLLAATSETSPQNTMIIVSEYELIEKSDNGVFC